MSGLTHTLPQNGWTGKSSEFRLGPTIQEGVACYAPTAGTRRLAAIFLCFVVALLRWKLDYLTGRGMLLYQASSMSEPTAAIPLDSSRPETTHTRAFITGDLNRSSRGCLRA